MADTPKATIKVDIESLTFREQIDFEDFTGVAIPALSQHTQLTTRMVVALIWITERRKNPAFTVDDAMELTYNDVEMTAGDSDPTEAAEPTPLAPLRADKGARRKATASS